MSKMDDMAPDLWQMLPTERRRAAVLILGQMTLRRLRGASVLEEKADDGERLHGCEP